MGTAASAPNRYYTSSRGRLGSDASDGGGGSVSMRGRAGSIASADQAAHDVATAFAATLSTLVARRRIRISPFLPTVTSLALLHRAAAPGSAMADLAAPATQGDGEPSAGSVEGRSSRDDGGGEGEDITPSPAAEADDAAIPLTSQPHTIARTTSRPRRRLAFRRFLVFEFTIAIAGTPLAWTLRKSTKHFARLATALAVEYASVPRPAGAPPPPSLPAFPASLRFARTLREFAEDYRVGTAYRLRSWLQAVIGTPMALLLPSLREFVELSPMTLNPLLGARVKEGPVRYAVDEVAARNARCLSAASPSWRGGWAVLRSNGIVEIYTREAALPALSLLPSVPAASAGDGGGGGSDGSAVGARQSPAPAPAAVVTLQADAQAFAGRILPPNLMLLCHPWGSASSGSGRGKYDAKLITVVAGDLHLELACPSKVDAETWLHRLRNVMEQCAWCRELRLGSFAPPRTLTPLQWFVDGRNAFCAVLEAVRHAKHEVLLTGWWLTPELAVVRDERGMRGFTDWVRELVCDAKAAAASAGRDGDESSVAASAAAAERAGSAGGGEDTTTLRLYLKDALQRKAAEGVRIHVLTWQEPPLTLALASAYHKRLLQDLGPNVYVMRHGSLFWTHHEKIVVVDRNRAFLGGVDICYGRWDTGGHVIADPDKLYFPQGVEWYNSTYADWSNVQDPWTDRFDRSRYPRIAWHDVHACIHGPSGAVDDVVRHFVQRWNYTKRAKGKARLPYMTPHAAWDAPEVLALQARLQRVRMPGTAGAMSAAGVGSHARLASAVTKLNAMAALAATVTRPLMPESASALRAPVVAAAAVAPPAAAPAASPPPPPSSPGAYCRTDWTQKPAACDVQLLRSVGAWSLGIDTECSVYHAYIYAILNASHSIYIENQYFLASLGWTREELVRLETAASALAARAPPPPPPPPQAGLPSAGTAAPADVVGRLSPPLAWRPRFPDVVAAARAGAGAGAGHPGALATAPPPSPHPSRWGTVRRLLASGEHAPTPSARGGDGRAATAAAAGASAAAPAESATAPHAAGVGRSLLRIFSRSHESAGPGGGELLRRSPTRREGADVERSATGSPRRGGGRWAHVVDRFRSGGLTRDGVGSSGGEAPISGEAGAAPRRTDEEPDNSEAVAAWLRAHRATRHALQAAGTTERGRGTARAGPAAPPPPASLPPSTAHTPARQRWRQAIAGVGASRRQAAGGAGASAAAAPAPGPAVAEQAPSVTAQMPPNLPSVPAERISWQEVVEAWEPSRQSVAEALFVRIAAAIEKGEAFCAAIVIPVHPDGPIRTLRATQLVLHWQSATIGRGGWSLLERLHKRFPEVDLSRYVAFYALRTWDTLGGVPVTEQVYVHSKVMIVDDRVVVMGSANLNDRSQYGDRDSEIAMLITGGEEMMTTMAGRPWRATRFAHTLRRNLWEEHLGVPHSCAAFAADADKRMDNAHVPFAPLRQLAPAELFGSAGPPAAAQPTSAACCTALEAPAPTAAEIATPRPRLHIAAPSLGDADAKTRDGTVEGGTSEAGTLVSSAASIAPLPTSTSVFTAAAASASPRASAGDHVPAATASAVQAAPAAGGVAGPSSMEPAADAAAVARVAVQRGEALAALRALITAGAGAGAGAASAGSESRCCVDALQDPVAAHDAWHKVARFNTALFDCVFPGVISDRIKTLRQWREAEAQPPRNPALLEQSIGKLVLWPTRFLEDEDLGTKVTEKEHWLPQKVTQ